MVHVERGWHFDCDILPIRLRHSGKNMKSTLRRVGVRGHLLFACFGISALAVLGAIVAMVAFAKARSEFDRITQERMPASFAALELSRQAERIAAAGPLFLASASADQQFRTDREIRQNLAELDRLLIDFSNSRPNRASLLDISSAVTEIRQNLAQLQALIADPFKDMQVADRLDRGKTLLQSNREASARLTAAITRMVDDEKIEIVKAAAEVAATQRNSTMVLLAVVVLSLIASVLIVWLYVDRRIIRRLTALSDTMLALAEGNLKTPLPAAGSPDEIGDMADTLRIFRDTALEKERVERLRRFLAPQIAELIVSSGDESVLESHRRDVAVLFCDLRGFTAFAEAAEPEEIMVLLREYHGLLGQLVHKFAGTLERFTGDGLIVLFNDPLPCPDPCVRAARLAVDMRLGVGELARRWRQRGSELGFGVGIAYGYATLGRVGFEGRFDYTAIGSVVNLAARLCERARPDEILVDVKVHAAIAEHMEMDDLGEFVPKGFSRPVQVFNITRALNP
jgi:class 3 adenylate cyclase